MFSGADIIYNALTTVNNDILKTSVSIKSFMTENIKEKIRILSKVLDVDQSQKYQQMDLTACSLRSKDPEWFEGMILVNIIVDYLSKI